MRRERVLLKNRRKFPSDEEYTEYLHMRVEHLQT
jgi:hypothetical protein